VRRYAGCALRRDNNANGIAIPVVAAGCDAGVLTLAGDCGRGSMVNHGSDRPVSARFVDAFKRSCACERREKAAVACVMRSISISPRQVRDHAPETPQPCFLEAERPISPSTAASVGHVKPRPGVAKRGRAQMVLSLRLTWRIRRASVVVGGSELSSNPSLDSFGRRHAMQFAKRLLMCAIAITAMLAWLDRAKAGLLGSTLRWRYYAFGGAHDVSHIFVADGSMGGTFNPYFNIIADDASLRFDYAPFDGTSGRVWTDSPLSLAPTIRNGIAIDVVEGDGFRGISISPETNMKGFNASRLSFTERQLQVDWMGLAFSNSTLVKLEVVTVPEPSSIALLAIAAAGAVVMRSYRQRVRSFSLTS
jgi:hypothetical protein